MTPNIVTDLPWVYKKFIPNKHLIVCPVRNAKILGEKIIEILNGNIKLDLSSAYDVVFENINYEKENSKLESFYKYLLNKIINYKNLNVFYILSQWTSYSFFNK